MIVFQVPDMTCGHCAKAITEAVRQTDAAAVVQVDLAEKRVRIDTARAAATALADAIRSAGYTPTHLPGQA